MTIQKTDISYRKASIVAGFGLLICMVTTPIGYFYIINNLIVPGDAAATFNQFM